MWEVDGSHTPRRSHPCRAALRAIASGGSLDGAEARAADAARNGKKKLEEIASNFAEAEKAARKARTDAEEKAVMETRAIGEAQGAHTRLQQADAALLHAKQAQQEAEETALAKKTAADTGLKNAESAASAKVAAGRKAKEAEARVYEKAAEEAKAAMEAIHVTEADAVADVKAAVAAQVKAKAERAAAPPQARVPVTPNTLGLPAPPPPPGGGGALPPDWQEASGPTGVYYYNTRTQETSWTRPAGGPPPGAPGRWGGAPQPGAPHVPKKLGLTARLGWR